MEVILQQLIGSSPHYSQGFIHSSWLFGISEPSTVILPGKVVVFQWQFWLVKSDLFISSFWSIAPPGGSLWSSGRGWPCHRSSGPELCWQKHQVTVIGEMKTNPWLFTVFFGDEIRGNYFLQHEIRITFLNNQDDSWSSCLAGIFWPWLKYIFSVPILDGITDYIPELTKILSLKIDGLGRCIFLFEVGIFSFHMWVFRGCNFYANKKCFELLYMILFRTKNALSCLKSIWFTSNPYLEPQTTIYKWMFGETTIFYIKIWGSRYPCSALLLSRSYRTWWSNLYWRPCCHTTSETPIF